MTERDPGRPSSRALTAELTTLVTRQRAQMRSLGEAASTLAAIQRSRSWQARRLYRRLRGVPLQPIPGPSVPDVTNEDMVRGCGDDIGRLETLVRRLRADLVPLDREYTRLHRELQAISHSRYRRLAMFVGRCRGHADTLARHPGWTLAAFFRIAARWSWIGALRVAWHRFWWDAAFVRFAAPVSQTTTVENAADAVRWLAPVQLSGETHHALYCHPDSTVRYQIDARPGGSVKTAAGLLPQVWGQNTGGVEFELTVSIDDGRWQRSRRIRVDPSGRFADRRWRPLSVRLPRRARGQVDITLATRVPAGRPGGHAWAIWGEPRLEWRRSRQDLARSWRGLLARLRHGGLRGTLRQLRDLEGSHEHVARYRRWVELHTPTGDDLARMTAEAATFAYRPLISVVTPVYNTDAEWLRACIESVRRQAYPHWELCLCDDGSTSEATARVLAEYEADPRIRIVRLAANAGIGGASRAASEIATGEFIALLDHDDELTPDALYEVVKALGANPTADMIYSDEDKLDAAGERCDPYFKPDWSPEHFLSTMYTCHLTVVRASVFRSAGGFREGYDGAQDYDLVLRVIERTDAIHHIPKVLYHWRKLPESVASATSAKTWAMDAGERALADYVRRNAMDAVVVPGPAPGLYRVRHRVVGRPLVSIVIPCGNSSREIDGRSVPLLANCVQSIVAKTTYDNYEIVVVDEGELSDVNRASLVGVRHRLVSYRRQGQFNYANTLNFGVAHSEGSQLMLFNDDLEIITPEWIEAMLEYSQQDVVGAVGPKLIYPDGRLQHIGVVMGVCGMAAHAFHSHSGASAGYGSSALIVRNYSALTAACLMTRRALYEGLGGFDARFVFDFNDTDFCLRLRAAGYRLVFTPYAQLYHLEAATFGARSWNAADLERMHTAWAGVCEHDPYYNPNLTRDFPDYRVRLEG